MLFSGARGNAFLRIVATAAFLLLLLQFNNAYAIFLVSNSAAGLFLRREPNSRKGATMWVAVCECSNIEKIVPRR
jgi:hypothetical protein